MPVQRIKIGKIPVPTLRPSIRPIFDFIFFFFFGLAELLVMMKSSTHTREG
jgi:hypothetical protein